MSKESPEFEPAPRFPEFLRTTHTVLEYYVVPVDVCGLQREDAEISQEYIISKAT